MRVLNTKNTVMTPNEFKRFILFNKECTYEKGLVIYGEEFYMVASKLDIDVLKNERNLMKRETKVTELLKNNRLDVMKELCFG